MARVVNKSSRSYIIGGVTLLPHVPADIDDAYMKKQAVRDLMVEGNLEVYEPVEKSKTKGEMERAS